MAARISEKLEEGDVRGAIRLAASEDTLARPDEQSLAALRLKHPSRAITSRGPPSLPANPNKPYATLILRESDIVDAIKSFPAGSAAGLDGLRPQHLKDMTTAHTGGMGQRLISCLTDFANLCLAGRVPISVRPIFCGASLCALNKKDGGIRPIAVGCTLRRLVAKAAAKIVQGKMSARMSPTQLGFGVKQGTEAAAHAVRRFVQNLQPNQAIIKLDFVNAFNTLSRDEILHTVIDEVPELYHFVSTCYDDRTNLCFGDYLVGSDEGIQQGDPLGPLLFCISSLKLAKSLKSELNVWYMDDGTIGGDVDVLMSDVGTVRRIGAELGLILNDKKCEIITDDFDLVVKVRKTAPEMLHVRPFDATLLGAPIGNDAGIDAALSKKSVEFRYLADRLVQLSAHDAFFLLKNCFSLPKLQYILRCAPCYRSPVLKEYDELIRITLQSVLNITLSDAAWRQATLPIRNGGIGIRLATEVALPAFLSSTSSSRELAMQIFPHRLQSTTISGDKMYDDAVIEWQSRSTQIQPPQLTGSQKAWDAPLIEVAVRRMLSVAPNQVGIARLIAAAAPHSGDFLQALPCSALGTRLDDMSLRIAVALRLGASVCAPHTCVCGDFVDSSGVHGLNCRKSAGRHMRHSALNDLIKRALASAEIPSRLEPTSLSRTDGKRPDGMSVTPWKQGRCLVWDVTCPNTLATSHLDRAVTGAGYVATEAEAHKHVKYNIIAQTHYFVPIAIETFGALGEEASVFLKDLGGRIAAVTKESRALQFLLQRISVAVQRGNAACVMGTSPINSDLSELFYF